MTRNTALLLLDLQNEMVDPKGKIGGGGLAKVVADRGVLAKAAGVLAWARENDHPVVFVRLGFRADYADALSVAPRIVRLKENGAAVLGTWGTEFPDAIAPRDDELVITKQCVNPFYNSSLLNWLLACLLCLLSAWHATSFFECFLSFPIMIHSPIQLK